MFGPRKRVYDWPDKVPFFEAMVAGASMGQALAPIGASRDPVNFVWPHRDGLVWLQRPVGAAATGLMLCRSDLQCA